MIAWLCAGSGYMQRATGDDPVPGMIFGWLVLRNGKSIPAFRYPVLPLRYIWKQPKKGRDLCEAMPALRGAAAR